MRLHDEHVRASHAFLGAEIDLSRGEPVELGRAHRHPEAVGDLPAERGMDGAGEQHHPLLRDDLHASVARLIVFRGIWIRVDPDFANRRLGGHAAGKPIGVDLAALRTDARSCQRLQLPSEFVRIVRESVEFTFPEHRRRGIRIRISTHRGRIVFLHGYCLRLTFERELNVESNRSGDVQRLSGIGLKTWGSHFDVVSTGC